VDIDRKKEHQQQVQEQKRLNAEAEASALKLRAKSFGSEASRILSQELAAKRAAQGDIVTRLAQVDVHNRSQQRTSQQEQEVNSANCQVSFATGLRGCKTRSPVSPVGGSCKQSTSTKSSKSLTSSSDSHPVGSPGAEATPLCWLAVCCRARF